MRIREYEYMRDLMKKLLYSLEQVNMQQIDKKGLDTIALQSDPTSGHIEGGQPKTDSSKLPDVNEQKRMSMSGMPSPG